MKLSEYKNEDALDLLADLLDPVSTIFSDTKLVKIVQGEGTKIQAIKYALKEYKKEIIEILSRLDGVEPKDYKASLPQMISELLELLNDKEMVGFFTQQGQQMDETSSGSAMENTKGKKM